MFKLNIFFVLKFGIVFGGYFRKVKNVEELNCSQLIDIIIPTDFNLGFPVQERIKKEKKLFEQNKSIFYEIQRHSAETSGVCRIELDFHLSINGI